MNLGLERKVILVTGGSKGIGLAWARAFLAEGARVAIVSRSPANLDIALCDLAAFGDDLIAIACNLTGSAAANRLVAEVEQRLGPVDVLINSAGAARRCIPENLSADAWHVAMDAKYFTYVHAMDAVLSVMVKRGRGAIVNIVGMGGKAAPPYHLPGGAANSALMLATVGLANVYGSKGIRINAINPGPTLTGRFREAVKVEAKTRGIPETEVSPKDRPKFRSSAMLFLRRSRTLLCSWLRIRQATLRASLWPWMAARTQCIMPVAIVLSASATQKRAA